MKILLILYFILFSLSTFSQTENDTSHEIMFGNWVLFKDSNSVGKIDMISDVFDTIRFSNNGKYERTIKTLAQDDAIVIENGVWNYSTNKKEIMLSQRTREYYYQGKNETYDFTKWPERIINIDKNQFIIVFTADANERNEVLEVYQFYRRL